MIEKVTRYIKLLRKYNSLETEYEVLQEYIKEDCFNKIIDKIGEPAKVKRLEEDNERLRLKVKEYKEMLIKRPEVSSKKRKYKVNCK